MPAPASRWLVWVAITFLLLDACLLAVAGYVAGREWLLVAAILLVLAALGVRVLARRYDARWQEVQEARREAGDQARILAETLRRSKRK